MHMFESNFGWCVLRVRHPLNLVWNNFLIAISLDFLPVPNPFTGNCAPTIVASQPDRASKHCQLLFKYLSFVIILFLSAHFHGSLSLSLTHHCKLPHCACAYYGLFCLKKICFCLFRPFRTLVNGRVIAN